MQREFQISLKWILAHIAFAFLSVYVPMFPLVWGLAAMLIGSVYIIKNKNRNNEAAEVTAYIAGLEIIQRMQNAMLGYEMAKYSVIGFLLLGMALEQRVIPRNKTWITALLLLVPSMFLADSFEGIRFSASGIIALLLAAYYFQGRYLSKDDYYKLLSFIILPIISAAVVVTLKTPDYSAITFTAESMAVMSGGYGPIHVSTILSIGLLILIIFMMIGESLFKNKWLNYLVIFLMAFRVIFTFARSGLLSLILSLTCVFLCFTNDHHFKKNKSIISLVIVGIVFLIAWSSIDSITGGMSKNRFTGRNDDGDKKEDVTTGRSELNKQDLEIFSQYPIAGIGVGNVAEYRITHYGLPHTSHMEYTRLLAEHGLFGLFVVLILIIEPLKHYKTTRGYTRLFFVAFVVFTLTNMIPAATRTAMPMFLYGLAFTRIKEDYHLT